MYLGCQFSLYPMTDRFIEVIQGRGRNDSPGEVGAAAVELTAAMFASAAAGGKPVAIRDWRGGNDA